jgi:TatD DNase family protein
LHSPHHDEHEVAGVPTAETFDVEYYRALAQHPKVVAIGEFGLDYYRVPEGIDLEALKNLQKESVRQQLQFAVDMNKPVVIHCRDAHADQIELLKEQPGCRGVIHCFTGTAQEAAEYAKIGFLVSITGIVTFGKNIMDMVREVPLEQMMVETDSPYLTPAPYRGKRNEPANVALVAQKIAEIKGVSFEEVARRTTENAIRLFGLY